MHPLEQTKPESLMLGRRALVFALIVSTLPLNLAAEQPRKLPRLCFMTFDPGSTQSNRFSAFFDRLRDLGYVDGKTITVHYLSAEVRASAFLRSPRTASASTQT
jgi:putative tryptophan/tyrosine transport system substrate-binding protein